MREIGARFGIRSTNGVDYHLRLLERERLIHRRRGLARGLAVAAESHLRYAADKPQASGAGRVAPVAFPRIPILGRIAAGEPLFADQQFDGYLDGQNLSRLGCDFALRVQGTSMIGAGILPGDLVLVQKDPEPREGEIVVALIGDEATVKRISREPGRVVLKAENPEFPPITIDAASPPAAILGRVVGIYREMG